MAKQGPPFLSAGAIALGERVEALGGVGLMSEKLEIVAGTLRHQIAGRSKPTKARRKKFKALFGIPLEAWEQPVPEKGAAAPAEMPAVAPPAVEKDTPPPIPEVEQTDDIRKITTDTLRTLRGLLQVADRDSMASIAQAISAQSRILARVSGQFEVTQAQIVRSPHFREAMGVLERALEPYPDAARAVAKAFEELQR